MLWSRCHLEQFHALDRGYLEEQLGERTRTLRLRFDRERAEREAEIHRLRSIDLTRLSSDLTRVNAELEQSNKFKIDLMGMLAYEIGNPLAAIQGYAELGPEALQAAGTSLAHQAFAVVERATPDRSAGS